MSVFISFLSSATKGSQILSSLPLQVVLHTTDFYLDTKVQVITLTDGSVNKLILEIYLTNYDE